MAKRPVPLYAFKAFGAARKAARKKYGDSRTMAAYLRKIAIDGYIFQVDHSDIKAMAPEIQKIGGNVKQISKRVNATRSVCQEDIIEFQYTLSQALDKGSIWTASFIIFLSDPYKKKINVYESYAS